MRTLENIIYNIGTKTNSIKTKNMREIKFRGQRIDNKQWIYGSLSVEYDGSCSISYWESKLFEPENNYSEMVCVWHDVIPETVGQFTGIEDKNGIEIFENDILKCYDYSALDETWLLDKIHTGIIEWTSPIYTLRVPGKIVYDTPCVKSYSEDVYLNYWDNSENKEVLGNIHETPELLK